VGESESTGKAKEIESEQKSNTAKAGAHDPAGTRSSGSESRNGMAIEAECRLNPKRNPIMDH
jgi:hypothetical protein